MESRPQFDDNALKLYAMLVDQIHKYGTILWQFPTALLVANLFAVEKFRCDPFILLGVSLVDAALVHGIQRVVVHQRAIIAAAQNVERGLSLAGYDLFIPRFERPKIPGQSYIVAMLWALVVILFGYSLYKIVHN